MLYKAMASIQNDMTQASDQFRVSLIATTPQHELEQWIASADLDSRFVLLSDFPSTQDVAFERRPTADFDLRLIDVSIFIYQNTDEVTQSADCFADFDLIIGLQDFMNTPHVFLKAAQSKAQKRAECFHEMHRLRRLSLTDPLTGLYNRRHFQQRVRAAVSTGKRHGHPLTVALFDLDHFKEINDSYGHLLGDEVLQSVADVIRTHSRIEDIPCRFGGDEFALILPMTNHQNASIVVGRIETAVRNLGLAVTNAGKLDVNISAGFSELRASDSYETLLARADDALYSAKKSNAAELTSRAVS